MRKKSKKKQIVAMTLALSVLSSSVGMCGASAAEALPQTGTTSWMAGVLASLGSLLLACGWFFTRKQVSPKH